jgi:tripartite-type tricarboxylate transporter receptor subunit TctC
MMKARRRDFLALAAAAAALPRLSRAAWALDYPARPVRLIVATGAGGSPDIVARLIGQWLSERLGQPFVVDNRSGASTNIGTEIALKATPDGATLLFAMSANAINAALYRHLNFNFMRDAEPVASIARIPLVMEVNPAVPAKTVPEFIAYAKANPGKVNLASGGPGTPLYVAGALFSMMADIKMTNVWYRGGEGAAIPDLLSGQVQAMFGVVPFTRLCATRQAARAGGDGGEASPGLARRSRHGRVSAGLRSERLVRHCRTQRDASGDRRHAEQADQCRARRSEHENTFSGSGL